MPSDNKKNVEIKFTVSGLDDPKSFNKFKESLNTLQKTVDSFQKSITSLKSNKSISNLTNALEKLTKIDTKSLSKIEKSLKSLQSIKDMPKLGTFVNDLKKFSGIKLPALGQFTSGMERLAKISSIKFPDVKTFVSGMKSLSSLPALPDLSNFVTELGKFAKIKLPATYSFARGLKKLSEVPTLPKLDTFVKELQKFAKVKLPNASSLATGLKKLTEIKNFPSLTTFVKSLEKFSSVKLPNVGGLASGLKKLEDLKKFPNLSPIVTQLQKLSTLKVPNIGQIGTGLKALVNLNVSKFATNIKNLSKALTILDKNGRLQSFDKFSANIAAMNRNLQNSANTAQKADSSFKKLDRTVQNTTRSTKSFVDRLQLFTQYRSMWMAFQAIINGFVGARTAIIEYDQALKDLQAITGSTEREVGLMGEKIQQVAVDTKFSTTEIAEGMKLLGQAGFSASESIQTINAVSDLATGTLTSMSTVVDLTTTAMKSFHIETSKSNKVADIFANAVNRSKLTIDKLRVAMNYVGPVANDAGISLDEVVSSLGVLANAGLRASTSATGMRRVIAQLVSPSDKFSAAIQKAGFAVADIDPRVTDFNDVIKNLRRVISDTGVAFEVFGKRGASAALALTSYEAQYDQMLSTIQETGTASKMAKTQLEGLGASIKNMFDRFKVLATKIGEAGVTAALKKIVEGIKLLTEVGIKFIDSNLVKSFVEFTAALLKATVIVGASVAIASAISKIVTIGASLAALGLPTILANISAAWVSFTTMIAGTNPIILAAMAAVSALTLLLSSFSNKQEDLSKSIDDSLNAFDKLKDINKSIIDYRKSIVVMEEGSNELRQTNLRMKDTLLDMAKTVKGDLVGAAFAASASIDALTGKVQDGSQAIESFNEMVKEQQKIKLEDSADKTNKLYKDASGNLDELKQKIADLKEEQAKADSGIGIGSKTSAMISKELELVEKQYADFSEIGAKAFDTIYKAGKISMSSVASEAEVAGRAFGLSGASLKAYMSVFDQFKENMGPTSFIGEWAEDLPAKEVADFAQNYKDSAKIISEADKKRFDEYKQRQQEFVDSMESEKEVSARLAADATTQAEKKQIWQDYYAWQADQEKQANKLHTEMASDSTYQVIESIKDEMQKRNELLEQNEESGKNTEAMAKRKFEIIAESERKITDLLKEQSNKDVEIEIQNQKKELSAREIQFKNYLLKLEYLRSQDKKSSLEVEALKAKATINYYKSIYKDRVALYNKIKKLGDETETQKAYEAKEAAHRKYLDTTFSMTSDNYQKEADEVDKHTSVIENAEEKLADKRISINKKANSAIESERERHADAIIGIEEKIINEQKSLTADIIGIEKKIADEKYDIQYNSLSDQEKLLADRRKIEESLAKASELVSSAGNTGDKEKIDLANDYLNSALSTVSALEDQNIQYSLLDRISKQLKESRKAESEITVGGYEIEKQKEEELHTKKLANIEKEKQESLNTAKDIYADVISKENIRHKKVLSHLYAERAAFEDIKKIAKEIANIQGGTDSDSDSGTTTLDWLKDTGTENIEVEVDFDTSKAEMALDNTNQKVTEMQDEIKLIDGVWTNVFSRTDDTDIKTTEESLRNSKESIKDISKEKDNLEKVGNDLAKIGEFESPSIQFPYIDSSIAKIETLVDSINELKDKTITITQNVVTNGSSTTTAATGKRIPGYGGGDSVNAMLEPGEWVIRKEAVRKFGDSFFNSLNSLKLPRFQSGGPVSAALGSSNISNANVFDGLKDFGKVTIDTGSTSIPAIAHTNVISELNKYLIKARRFSS